MLAIDNLPLQLDLEGSNNFRDLGGYPLCQGGFFKSRLLYRSDHLANLSDADRQLIAQLGVKTVIDLRRRSEREEKPDRLGDLDIHQIWLPVRAEGADVHQLRRGLESGTIEPDDAHDYLVEANIEFVRRYASVYQDFFALLLEPDNYPVVFHCSAGKDRAGFAAAMALLVAGASLETVFYDYMATNHCTARYVNGIIDGLSDIPMISRLKASPDAIRALMQARTEYLQAAFDTIASDFGTVEAFLDQGLKLGPDNRQRLRSILCE
jgi:protein-tyrosine phosphatase